MGVKLIHSFEDIISVENLLLAWEEFLRGKRNRADVQEFSLRLADNVIELRRDLANLTYNHGQYQVFFINDPKPRIIHKAAVRDRLLHHAVYRKLYPFFDKVFIADSFSCRLGKGTHKAVNRFRHFSGKVSQNNTKTCWILKGDIRKFFASVNQNILLDILKEYIPDQKIIWLLEKIIGSFYSAEVGIGLPLGNLTSQLLANVYLNKFDQFAKHKLKIQYYIRYADDFVVSSQSKPYLLDLIEPLRAFLSKELKLDLHPDKIFVKTLFSGVDFLGWVNFPDHRVLRHKTAKRMQKRIGQNFNEASLNSYLGLLKHGNTNKLRDKLLLCTSIIEPKEFF